VPVKLEGPTHLAVLLRAEGGVVGKVRAFTEDCPLDAGGLPVHWLTEVKPAESVALLVRYAEADSGGHRSMADQAVAAVAQHAAAEATAALEKLATSPQRSEATRKSAVFWLANARGRAGYQVVARLVREDASDKLREHAVFALTQSHEPEAIPAIIKVAHDDRSPHVRGQALFWLAQQASHKQAAGAISEALDRDPDTEVKKKAVFALSQLPADEGIPRLLQVARTHANPAVRKQAMFWLGQSKDPRALKFFEEVLTK
jgi:HEAT repeat protein